MGAMSELAAQVETARDLEAPSTISLLPLAAAIERVSLAGCRVLFPFTGGARVYLPTDGEQVVRRGLMLDTETTGADVQRDQIIQLAAVPFTFGAQGEILEVGPAAVMYEEPTIPISEDASAVHGITMDRLVGQRFDDAFLLALMQCDLLIAHNAAFDRPMLDRRFPTMPKVPWGCSYVDVPWRQAMYPSAALGALLIEHTDHFFAGHDAAADCFAALHCLASPFTHESFTSDTLWPLSHVLTAVTTPRARLFANGAPFESKDLLSKRGYRWNDPTKAGAAHPRGSKAWFIELDETTLEAEYTWLTEYVYRGANAKFMARTEPVPATSRFARGA